MSKLKRLLGALSLVSLFIFSSCVEDSVAPEVTALRQAQVDLLNADIAFRNAQTALQTAQADAQGILNAFNTANNAIILASNQADLDEKLADLEVALADAATALEVANLELIQAQDELAEWLANNNLTEAAGYLAAWEAVMFGGNAPTSFDNSGLTIPATTSGIVGLRQQIIALENELAIDALLLTADDSVRRAWVEAQLDQDLADLNTALAADQALIPILEGLIADLESNDGFAAIAALQAELLELYDDSIAARAAMDAAAAARAAGSSGAVAAAEADTAFFHANYDDPALFSGTRTNYRTSYADSVEHAELVAAFTADVAAWNAYADSLQAIYDEFHVLYSADFELTLFNLAVDTFNASIDAGDEANQALEDANEVAFADFKIALNNFNDLDALAGYVLTRADSQDVITARASWDGLNQAILLPNGFGGAWEVDANLGANYYNTSFDPATAEDGALANADPGNQAASTGVGFGGAWAELLIAQTGTGALDLAEALIRYENALEQYEQTVSLFAELQAFIDGVKAGTNDEGTFNSTAVPFVTDLSNITDAINFVNSMNELLQTQKNVLTAALTEAGDIKTFCDHYAAAFGDPGNAVCAQDQIASVLSPNAKAAATGLADNTTASTAANANLAFAQSTLAEQLPGYLAALAVLDQTQDALDGFTVGDVALISADIAASSAFWAINAQILGLRGDIADIEAALSVLGLDDDNQYELTTFASLIASYEGLLDLLNGSATTAGSIANTQLAIEELEVDILLFDQEGIELAALTAEKQLQLEALQAELTLLESIAAQLQALLEAALAG